MCRWDWTNEDLSIAGRIIKAPTFLKSPFPVDIAYKVEWYAVGKVDWWGALSWSREACETSYSYDLAIRLLAVKCCSEVNTNSRVALILTCHKGIPWCPFTSQAPFNVQAKPHFSLFQAPQRQGVSSMVYLMWVLRLQYTPCLCSPNFSYSIKFAGSYVALALGFVAQYV